MSGAKGRRGTRPKTILRLLVLGVLALLLAPAYAYYGVFCSGRLALAQQAPASEILRGFDFGPVWLEQGEVGRYFITATLPQSDTATWNTSFEVLNSALQPVFRQDEVRFIGEYQFHPGQRERSHHQFTLQKGTGYYYFRFHAHNGVYSAAPGAAPVVQFAIRQRVVNGMALWGPVTGLLLLGLMLIGLAVAMIARIGQKSTAAQTEPGTATVGKASVVHG
jgi:hypothetical protein